MFYECLLCLAEFWTGTNGREIWKGDDEIKEWRYGQITITISLMGGHILLTFEDWGKS